MFEELVKKTRSYRNFDRSVPVSEQDVVSLIGLCRYTPSTANRQPLKFAYAVGDKACGKLFPLLSWAGYLSEKPPYCGNEPTAYILICCDTEIMSEAPVDVGICAQTLVLAAADKGIAACMLGAFPKEKAAQLFDLPGSVKPVLVIALGAPNEKIVVTDAKNGEIRYYRDEAKTHYVPKRPLDEILLGQLK